MSRAARLLIIVLGIVVVAAGIGYAAHSLDLAGMIAKAHTPPQH
jgi:hypothetical protein